MVLKSQCLFLVFLDSDDDMFLSQQANKIKGKYMRDNVPNMDIGFDLEEVVNSSSDTIESGCHLKLKKNGDEEATCSYVNVTSVTNFGWWRQVCFSLVIFWI